MRSFGATFAAELVKTNNRPFWTIVFHYSGGDVYVTSRKSGTRTILLVDLGAIGSAVGRSSPGAMDVLNTDVAFVNMPMRADLPGQLAASERLVDRWDRYVETRLAEVYLSIEVAGPSVVEEIMLPAILGSPSGGGFRVGNAHLASLSEKYLNASVLRKINPAQYPFGYNLDNATVPLALGHVPQTLGRIVKGSRVSVPVAGVNNISTASLGDIIVADNAGSQTWTVEFQDKETVQSVQAPNAALQVNIPTNTGSIEHVIAQSFSLGVSGKLASITVRFKTTGTPDSNPFHSGFPMHAIRVEVWTDSGGAPGTRIGKTNYFYVRWSSTYYEQKITLPVRLSLSATTYWILVFGSPGAHAYGAPWSAATVANTLYLGANSAGSYAGGKAKHGTFARGNYTTDAVFFFGAIPSITWDTTLDAYDLWFKLGFEANTYSLTGSLSGFDGAGSPNTDFESNSKAIKIPRASWKGIPQPGDTFVFTTDPANSLVIFSESPTSGPVDAVNQVYLDGTPLVDTADVVDDYAWGGFVIAFGYQSQLNPPIKPEVVGLIRKYDVVGTKTFVAIGVRFGKVGFPTNPCRYSILADNDGVPDLTRVLVKVDVPLDEILPCAQSGASGPGFLVKRIPPLTVSDTTVWIMVDTDNFQFGSYNYYLATMSNVGSTEISYARDVSGALYQTSWRFAFELIGAGVITDPERDDGFGNQVAVAELDFELPRSGVVTADVDGVKSGADVVESPDDVIHYLLNYAGVADADIDLAGTFAASAAFYAQIPIVFSGTVLDDLTFKTLILALAFECRSVFKWGILAALVYQPNEYAAAVGTIALDDILRDSNREPIYRFERSTQDEIVNSITMKYDQTIASGQYKRTIKRFVPDSIDNLSNGKPLENKDHTELKFIRTREAAQAIADWRLARQAYPFIRHFLSTLLPFAHLETDDPVGLDLTNGADVLLGMDGSQILQIESAAIVPSRFSLDFVLRELVGGVKIEDGDGYVQLGTIVVLRDQGDMTTLWDYAMGAPPVGQWTAPSTTDAPVYDGITLAYNPFPPGPGSPAAMVLYIENGVRKFRDSGGFGSTYDWDANDSYPPAWFNGSSMTLEIDL